MVYLGRSAEDGPAFVADVMKKVPDYLPNSNNPDCHEILSELQPRRWRNCLETPRLVQLPEEASIRETNDY